MQVEQLELGRLIPYVNNSRTHSEEQVAQVAASIREFGFTNPILIDESDSIIAGHGRLMAAQKLGLDEVPCIRLAHLSDAQKKAYVIADNKLALNAGWDDDLLALELGSLKELDFDLALTGFDAGELEALFDDDGEAYAEGLKGQMSSDFGLPPFTVLNAREGGWQKRKQYWLSYGINSEEGRPENLISYSSVATMGEKDTSIFDPVLCDLMYSWFSPKNGLVLDPFAGGSVRGIIASLLDRQYIGVDLRPEQVAANQKQAEEIITESPCYPAWYCGDSTNIKKIASDVQADMIMSCPPYADLEVYSDKPNDLSNMEYAEFLSAYKEIISQSYSLLKEDSFAVWTVGEVRDKKGNYYNFVGDTIQAFKDAGFHYYNEAILVTAVGSLPLRAGRTMRSTRKLGKTHQNILVFVKGDGKKAAKRCGDIEINIDTDDSDTRLNAA